MQKLQLERIELREIELPLKSAFETSFGVTTKRRVALVRVVDASGVAGFGECTAMERPLYNPESVDTAWSVILGNVVPMLASGGVSKAVDVEDALSAIKGNRSKAAGKAAVETSRRNDRRDRLRRLHRSAGIASKARGGRDARDRERLP